MRCRGGRGDERGSAAGDTDAAERRAAEMPRVRGGSGGRQRFREAAAMPRGGGWQQWRMLVGRVRQRCRGAAGGNSGTVLVLENLI